QFPAMTGSFSNHWTIIDDQAGAGASMSAMAGKLTLSGRNGWTADGCMTSIWVWHFLSSLGFSGRGRPMTESENKAGDRRNGDHPRTGDRRKGGNPRQIPSRM